jgi:CRP-like cAMP-binding protein
MEYRELAKYLDQMSIAGIHQVVRACNILEFDPGEHIFCKGDLSDKYYLILYGSVCVYNINKDNVVTFSNVIREGNKLGEQGLVTGMPRSMSAKANTLCFVLFMYRPAFKMYLEKAVVRELETQLDYIDKYFPNISRYGTISRIRIAYAIYSASFRRNKVILAKDLPYDCLYFIYEGECAIVTQVRKNIEKCVVKMGKGSCFGEECGLLGRVAGQTVKVTSEYAVLFYIKKGDVKRLVPEDVLSVFINNYYLKQKSRALFREIVMPASHAQHDQVSLASHEQYPMASILARKNFHQQMQRSQSSLGCKLNDPIHIGFKKKLRQFRSGVNLEEPHRVPRSRRSSLIIDSAKGSPVVSGVTSPSFRRSIDFGQLRTPMTLRSPMASPMN